jgi:hypothetical protein
MRKWIRNLSSPSTFEKHPVKARVSYTVKFRVTCYLELLQAMEIIPLRLKIKQANDIEQQEKIDTMESNKTVSIKRIIVSRVRR